MSDKDRDDLQNKERRNNPTGVFRDFVDQSMAGSPQELLRGGCLTKVLTLIVLVIGLLLLSRCSG
ncbi:hypothetical protein [Brevibacillus centrosporus]|uniref:hypothetical protein n=1 Tax=Brevibacillus centrosporus TaxID=54910 RepID=UPI003B023AE8